GCVSRPSTLPTVASCRALPVQTAPAPGRGSGFPYRQFSDYSQRMDAEMVGQVRSFNRAVTQRIGALNDAFLSRGRPLGEARVLWEIGPAGSDVRARRSLGPRLDLASGSRGGLLRRREGAGLVAVERSGPDGRVRTARLTSDGLAERTVLDRRSDDAAAAILEPLSARQRTRLVTAMA